jgi:hypothetical protein
MIILKEQNTAQSITFIPREMNATTIVLRNETTGVETNIVADFYLSDYYPIEINSWADQIFELFHNNNQKNLRVNIKLLKFLSMVGDFFVKLGFYNFYMQSRRLKNMTTNYVVNNNKLERITGRLPWNLDQATKNFVDCYKKNISK